MEDLGNPGGAARTHVRSPPATSVVSRREQLGKNGSGSVRSARTSGSRLGRQAPLAKSAEPDEPARRFARGAARTRTGDGGFAVLCLTSLATAPKMREGDSAVGRVEPPFWRAGSRTRTGDPHLGKAARTSLRSASFARLSGFFNPACRLQTLTSPGFAASRDKAGTVEIGPGLSPLLAPRGSKARTRSAGCLTPRFLPLRCSGVPPTAVLG